MATSMSPIISEANALYVGLFDRPADPSGQTYWINQSGGSSSPALSSADVTSIGSFAAYNYGASNAQPLNDANIAGEIVNIYSDLFGASVTTTNPGVEYWAHQYITGAQTIGQIVSSIYSDVQAIPSTNTALYIDHQTMDAKLAAAQTFTVNYASSGVTPISYAGYVSAASFLNNITQANVSNDTFQTNINGAQTAYAPVSSSAANSTYQAASHNYSFVGGTTGSDTLNLGGPPSSIYTYSITGGTGANTVDVNYAGVTAADLTTYLGSASGFQTLDFTTVPSAPLTLNLSAVDAGGFTTIQNAAGNETFNVNANTTSLTISDAAGQTTANVALGGDVTLGTLDAYPASPVTVYPTIVDIASNGTTPNTISTLDVAPGTTYNSNGVLIDNIVNISGSENLTITTASLTGVVYDFANFTGTSLTINGTDLITGATASNGSTIVNIIPGSTTTWGDASYTFNIATTASTAASTTLTAGNGSDAVYIASTTTTDSGANTITIGNTTAAAGNDSIVSYGTGAITATLGTSGSTGNDSITMYGANTAADKFTITSTGIDSVYMSGASTAGNTIIINGGAGTDTVSMTGGNTAANTVTVVGGTGAVNVTMTGGNSGANSITISGSGTDTVLVGQGNHTIDLGGTSGADTISIGQGTNTITLGSGADSINMTTLYSTTTPVAGANTLYSITSGTAFAGSTSDTLVFSNSTLTTTSALYYNAATQTTLGTESTTNTVAEEITLLNGSTYAGTASGDSSVGWTTAGTGNTYIVMAHDNAGTLVDQVIQIVGTASYLSSTTAVSINSHGFVSVAL